MFRLSTVSFKRVVVLGCITFIVLGLFLEPIVRAQSTSGTLAGQVFDSAGRALPGVKVTIVNETSGNAYATLTDGSGNYRRPFLTPGIYRITATLANYYDVSITTRVPLNQTTEIRPPDITLRPIASAQTGAPTTTTPTPTTTTPTTTTPTTTTPTTTTPAATGQGGLQETGSASMINKSDAARGGNFTEKQVVSLPLGGGATMRSFDELALLVPGVLPPPWTPGVRGPGVGFGIGSAGQFSVNGLRARSNNFTIDGSDNNDPDVGVRRQGFVALVPQSLESIQEFQISTLLWNAELGRNFGSQVNAVSKSGSLAYHGQAYLFYTNTKLNARNFFDTLDPQDKFKRAQGGFVIGGPIGPRRPPTTPGGVASPSPTQFFASFEYDDIDPSSEQHFATPTAGQRNFLSADAIATRLVVDGRPSLVVTPTGVAPIGDVIFSFYPLPNNPNGPYGANTFTKSISSEGIGKIASFKLTHQINLNNALSGRYNFTDDDRVLPSINRAINSTINSGTRTQNLSLILDTTLTTTIFNQARFSYGRTRLDFSEFADSPFVFQSNGVVSPVGIIPLDDPTDASIGTATSSTGPLGQITIEPFSPVGVDTFSFPQARRNNTFQYADTVSWQFPFHSLKFGADIRRYQLNSLLDRNFRPNVVFGIGTLADLSFDNQGSPSLDSRIFLSQGADLASLGIPSSIFQSITIGEPDSRIGLRFTEYNLFLNDNWRVRPNFTLDYGLRYEYNTVPREVNNRIENALTLQNRPQAGGSAFDSPQRTAAFALALSAYERILDGRTRIYDPDSNNFAPHVGFAWAPNLRTSLRGGYGLYYDTILGAVVSQSRNVFPNEVPINIFSGFTGFGFTSIPNPSFLFLSRNGNVLPLINPGTLNQFGGGAEDVVALLGQLFLQGGSATGLAFTLPAKNLPTPYAQQWHLTLEHEIRPDYLLSASYVGTKGTKLTRLTTPNLGPNPTPISFLSDPFEDIPIFVTSGSIPVDRPNPDLGPFQIFENSANSTYHALQLEARKRYNHGYTFTAAYTWSHALDDVSDVFPIAGAPILPQDSTNLQLEHADANFDVRHRFAASMVWDLPFYRDLNNRGIGRVLGGWQVTTIFQAHTGQPFTLNVPFDANFDGNLTDRPTTTDGLTFFDGHGPRRVEVQQGRTFLNFINPRGAVFFNQAGLIDFTLIPGTGFIGRNTLRGDGFINLDLALGKNFRVSESQVLEFRTEVFNVLNRANFGLPVRTIDAPGFGSSVDTVNPARIVQFALKYSF